MHLPPNAILVTHYRSQLTPEQSAQQQAIIAQDKARERFRKIFGSYPPGLISGARLSELFALERKHKPTTTE